MSARIRFPSGATIEFVGGTEPPLRGSPYDPLLFREGEIIHLTDLPGDTMDREQPHPMQSTAHIAPDTPVDTIEKDQQLREAFVAIYDVCAELLPEGRYKSIVMTGLEVAQMWAIKSVHHTPR